MANSADPDQTAPRSSLIRVYTVCHSICIVWTHYSMAEPHSSNFREFTTNFLGVRIFRKFTVLISIPEAMNKVKHDSNGMPCHTATFLSLNLRITNSTDDTELHSNLSIYTVFLDFISLCHTVCHLSVSQSSINLHLVQMSLQ